MFTPFYYAKPKGWEAIMETQCRKPFTPAVGAEVPKRQHRVSNICSHTVDKVGSTGTLNMKG